MTPIQVLLDAVKGESNIQAHVVSQATGVPAVEVRALLLEACVASLSQWAVEARLAFLLRSREVK